MKTILYTGHDATYAALAAITVPRIAQYAERHGYDFHCSTEPLLDVPNGIYWTGVCGALKAFDDGYERAIYLDVDQLITNYSSVLPDWGFGFHASKDWGEDAVEPWQFSMCGFVAHPDSVSLLRKAVSMEPEWRDRPFPEQNTVQEIAKNFTDMVTVHPRKLFNAVPDAVCPGKVPEPWVNGDWCAHLTMLPIDERVKLAKEIVATL